MAIPDEYQRLAEKYGVTRHPEQSEAQFISQLEGLRRYHKLIITARKWGTSITFGMTSREIEGAFQDRLRQLLTEAGIVPDATVMLSGRRVEIREITLTHARNPQLIVKYWIIDWNRSNNRGRATFADATVVLRRATPIS